MKMIHKFVLIVILILAFATPVYAMGYLPQVDEPVAVFKDLFIAVSAAVGVAAAITFILQLGKLFLPKMFPDGSMENWRLLLILVVTAVLYIGPLFGWKITLANLDVAMQSLAELGALLSPLFVWLADWVSKTFYKQVLRGRLWIGKSYSARYSMAAKTK